MKEITLTESKQIQLELLGAVHAFCEQHHLTYFLVFGTLLGAVRHHGFIPWDDDIDIAMPREDYEFLMGNFKSEHYKAVSCETDPSYYLPLGKVYDTRTVLDENVKQQESIGVYIDIFPIDRYSADEGKNQRATLRLKLYRDLLGLKTSPGSKKRQPARRVAHAVLSRLLPFVNMNRVSRKMNQIAKQFNGELSPPCYGIRANVSAEGLQRRYPLALFQSRSLYDFEGKQFYGPELYDEFLTLIYRDYMQLPPEDQRVSHHDYVQYWKDGAEQ